MNGVCCESACDTNCSSCNNAGACVDDFSGEACTLETAGLVSRYAITVRDSDTAKLADSGPGEPADLDMLRDNDEPRYITTASGEALAWNVSASDGRVCSPISSKVATAFNGASTGTIETVVQPEECNEEGSRFFHIGTNANWVFALGCRPSATANSIDILFSWTPSSSGGVVFGAGTWTLERPTSPIALHLVFDSGQAAEADRQRLYAGGSRVQALTAQPVTQNDTIAIDLATHVCVGNRELGGDSNRSIRGSIHYAAVYRTALDEATVLHHAQRLVVDDDAP